MRIVTNQTYFHEEVKAKIKFGIYLLAFVFGLFTPKSEDCKTNRAVFGVYSKKVENQCRTLI